MEYEQSKASNWFIPSNVLSNFDFELASGTGGNSYCPENGRSGMLEYTNECLFTTENIL